MSMTKTGDMGPPTPPDDDGRTDTEELAARIAREAAKPDARDDKIVTGGAPPGPSAPGRPAR